MKRRLAARDATCARRDLADLARLDDSGFRALFAKSAVKRIGRARFLRNVLIAIGNSGERGARGPRPSGCWTILRRSSAARRCGRSAGSIARRLDTPRRRTARPNPIRMSSPNGTAAREDEPSMSTLICFGLGYSRGTFHRHVRRPLRRALSAPSAAPNAPPS